MNPMLKSQTNISTNCNEGQRSDYADLMNEKRKQRTLVSRSFHFGNQVYQVGTPKHQEQEEGNNKNYQHEL
jgi:hypothetical protein